MLDKLFSKLKESGIEIDEDDFYYGAGFVNKSV